MSKEEHYIELVKQAKSLVEGENDIISVMANLAALIHEEMHFWWTGFYIARSEVLHLGPFQGPVACYRIPKGRGVCGTAMSRAETVIVEDVENFPGHITCSSESRSEIVVPVIDADGNVAAVLDIDSRDIATFDIIDKRFLEEIVNLIAPLF